MDNTAIVELFGSFFVSIASQEDNKEELMKHLKDFKTALYSQQGKSASQVDKYLNALELEVARDSKRTRITEAVEKFEKNNRVVYEHIRKLSRKEKEGRPVRESNTRPATHYQRKPYEIELAETLQQRRAKLITAHPLTDRPRLPIPKERSDHQLRYN